MSTYIICTACAARVDKFDTKCPSRGKDLGSYFGYDSEDLDY
jgi:hypothetical protein